MTKHINDKLSRIGVVEKKGSPIFLLAGGSATGSI